MVSRRKAGFAIAFCACIMFMLAEKEPVLMDEIERHYLKDEGQSKPHALKLSGTGTSWVAPEKLGGTSTPASDASAKFLADVKLLRPVDGCQRVPAERPLPQPTSHDINFSYCAFMPLVRPEPYVSYQLALLTDVVAILNRSLLKLNPATKWRVMPWSGSLLGAARDHELIPWTFDGDVLLPPPLSEELHSKDSEAVRSLFEAGIYTFINERTRRFCYHERAPRVHSPGQYSVCGKGDFENNHKQTYLDGYAANMAPPKPSKSSGVTVQFHKGLDMCVTPEDLLPNATSVVTIRDKTFTAPANTAKVFADPLDCLSAARSDGCAVMPACRRSRARSDYWIAVENHLGNIYGIRQLCNPSVTHP